MGRTDACCVGFTHTTWKSQVVLVEIKQEAEIEIELYQQRATRTSC